MGKEKRLTFTGGALGIIAAVVGGVFGQQMVRALFRPHAEVPSQQVLSKAADQMNRNLPMMVDRETELSATIGLEGMLVYNYRLVNLNAEEVQPSALEQAMRPTILNSACSTPETRDGFLKKGVTMRYSYRDQNGHFITSIDVAPKDCKF